MGIVKRDSIEITVLSYVGVVVGYVGNISTSTGNRLPFKIRLNGSRKDPGNYIKHISLYVRSGGTTKRLN